MSDLSPALQELVEAGKFVVRPTAADRERVFAALQARLAVDPTTTLDTGEPTLASARAPIGARSIVGKTVGITAVALTALTVGIVSLNSTTERATELRNPQAVKVVQRTSLPSAPATEKTAETVDQSLREVTVASAVAPGSGEKATQAASPARNKSFARDTLAEEVVILSRAQMALHSGNPQKALRILAEHERRFRRGVLAEERRTAKIQALCAIGSLDEANALLVKVSAQSVTGESARQACALSRVPAKTP